MSAVDDGGCRQPPHVYASALSATYSLQCPGTYCNAFCTYFSAPGTYSHAPGTHLNASGMLWRPTSGELWLWYESLCSMALIRHA